MIISASSLAVPLLTFILGALASYLAQRYWRRRDLLRRHAEAVVDLTTDWYEQLLMLRHEAREDGTIDQAQIDRYVRGRLILPKLLHSIAVLHNRGAFPELREAARDFLETVTSAKISNSRYPTRSWFDQRNCVALCLDEFSSKLWTRRTANESYPPSSPQWARTNSAESYLPPWPQSAQAASTVSSLQRRPEWARDTSPADALDRLLERLDALQQNIARAAAHGPD